VGEPDRRLWRTKADLLAVVVRHDRYGHLCGYVELPKGQTAFPDEQDYSCFDLTCHGGLTFHGQLKAELGGAEGAYWVGYDCNHSYDLSPNPPGDIWSLFKRPDAEYRTFAYCEEQCEDLARQIVEAIANQVE